MNPQNIYGMNFKHWFTENVKWLIENTVKKTLYRGTTNNSLSHNKRDNGDYGLGVYLTQTAFYAEDAQKATGKEPIILVIEHTFTSTANFDDHAFSFQLFSSLGIPENKVILPGQPQTRPYNDSLQITKELIRLGYDSAIARNGYEVIAYDESKLRIVDRRSVEDAFLLP